MEKLAIRRPDPRAGSIPAAWWFAKLPEEHLLAATRVLRSRTVTHTPPAAVVAPRRTESRSSRQTVPIRKNKEDYTPAHALQESGIIELPPRP
jgi:hypothetical protein